MRKIFSRTLIALFLLLPTQSHALPPEFTATYLAETYGVTAAQATYKLEYNNNEIIFTQHSETIGLAAIFSNTTLDETSVLSLHNNKLLLDEYNYIQKGDKNKDVHLKIKWDEASNNKLSGTISGDASGKPVQIKTNAPVWDTLSFQLPIMMDTNNETAPQKHKVLVKGKLKTYLFINHGVEEITVSNQLVKSLKIERKSDNKDKPLFLWIAPSLKNLPVKIEKWKKGKPHITMTLNSASFPSDKALVFKAKENLDDL